MTCPKCGASECNESKKSVSGAILCSYCGHVFKDPPQVEEKEVVVQIETSKRHATTKTLISNHPVGVIVLVVINVIFCFCDVFRELFNITIIDPLWGYWLIALSAMGLVAWGMAVKRYAFAGVFSFTLMMAVFYIWLPWYHR
ncbi:hypothetical protein DRH13_00345 [Candidatus Woesebacteria bacterium]|nr:MAG: hypothetical protein DRH13_00345 [Candidatus Woesebacteria bacterium]